MSPEIESLVNSLRFLTNLRTIAFVICMTLIILSVLYLQFAVALLWLALVSQMAFLIAHFRLMKVAKSLAKKAYELKLISKDLATLVRYS